MSDVTKLIRELHKLDGDIERLEDQLGRMKSRRHLLATVDLPEAMTEIGSSRFTTEDALTCEVSYKIYGSLPPRTEADKRHAAVEYLRELEADHIIKANLLVQFGRGNIREANKLKRRLSNMLSTDEPVTVDADVNHMTLQAWARERIKANKPLNMDILGLRGMTMATVKAKSQ